MNAHVFVCYGYWFGLFLQFWYNKYLILELSRQCDIFDSALFSELSIYDSVPF